MVQNFLSIVLAQFLSARTHLLCSKQCQHNVEEPNDDTQALACILLNKVCHSTLSANVLNILEKIDMIACSCTKSFLKSACATQLLC